MPEMARVVADPRPKNARERAMPATETVAGIVGLGRMNLPENSDELLAEFPTLDASPTKQLAVLLLRHALAALLDH
jgi:hypothetical protein